MKDELIAEVFTILQKNPINTYNLIKQFDWITFDELYFTTTDYLNDNQLIKIVPIYLDNPSNDIKVISNDIKIIPDNIYTEAQLNLYNFNLNSCLFFYCYIENNKIQRFTFNSIDKMTNFKYHLYRQYLHYQKETLNKLLINCTISRKRNRLQTKYNTPILPKFNTGRIIDNRKFISASKLKNYVFDDTLCDWLDEFNKNNSRRVYVEQTPYIEVFKAGIEFENDIVKEIKRRFPDKYVCISSDPRHSLEVSKFYETINAIKNGVPIILQGVLHDNINHTFGVPDIIIRCDYLNKLVPNSFDETYETNDETNENIFGQNIFGQNHYRIIDIKSSAIGLKARSENILNTPLTKYYKTQICLYNIILGIVQGYTPPKAYVLAKTLTQRNKVYSSFEKLGVINYETDDRFVIDLYKNAVSWIKYMRKNGADWDPRQPHIAELLPNIKNKYDYQWQKYKQDLVRNKSDILELWCCSTENRRHGLKNGINCWRTQQCDSEMLGFKKPNKITSIIDLMIKINKEPQEMECVYPLVIENNYKNWKTQQPNEFYLDFESIASDDYIFMIGMGFEKNKKWVYRQFILDNLDEQSEKKLLIEFFEFLSDHSDAKLFHWGNFEETTLNKKIIKHNLQNYANMTQYDLIDLFKIFKDEPILIRGALNFGLKTVAKAMFKNGFIKTCWVDDLDGLIVSSTAKKIYKNELGIGYFEKITRYNEIDCKVLWEILGFLRAYLIK